MAGPAAADFRSAPEGSVGASEAGGGGAQFRTCSGGAGAKPPETTAVNASLGADFGVSVADAENGQVAGFGVASDPRGSVRARWLRRAGSVACGAGDGGERGGEVTRGQERHAIAPAVDHVCSVEARLPRDPMTSSARSPDVGVEARAGLPP